MGELKTTEAFWIANHEPLVCGGLLNHSRYRCEIILNLTDLEPHLYSIKEKETQLTPTCSFKIIRLKR